MRLNSFRWGNQRKPLDDFRKPQNVANVRHANIHGGVEIMLPEGCSLPASTDSSRSQSTSSPKVVLITSSFASQSCPVYRCKVFGFGVWIRIWSIQFYFTNPWICLRYAKSLNKNIQQFMIYRLNVLWTYIATGMTKF